MVSSDDLKRNAVDDKGLVQVRLEGNPTILIVDDEELMREVSSIMVEEKGGSVITAVDGIDAVDVFAENQDKISAVFMDVSMPRMNGYEAYLEIRKLSPTVPVLIVSGLKMMPEVQKLQASNEIDFLSKPFHEVELIKALNKALARRKQ